MSKTYEECTKEVGLDLSKIEPPEQLKVWYAYVDGKAIKCDSQQEAKKYKLHEVVLDPDSKSNIVKFWDDRKKLEDKALGLFRESIRQEYSGMSDALFDMCYSGSTEYARSSDYDEIPEVFKFFADFAHKAIRLKK